MPNPSAPPPRRHAGRPASRGGVPLDVLVGGLGVIAYATAQAMAAENPISWIISGAVLLGIWARIEWGNRELRQDIKSVSEDVASVRELVGREAVSKQITEAMSRVASRAGELTGTLQNRMRERDDVVDRRFERLEEDIRDLRRTT